MKTEGLAVYNASRPRSQEVAPVVDVRIIRFDLGRRKLVNHINLKRQTVHIIPERRIAQGDPNTPGGKEAADALSHPSEGLLARAANRISGALVNDKVVALSGQV